MRPSDLYGADIDNEYPPLYDPNSAWARTIRAAYHKGIAAARAYHTDKIHRPCPYKRGDYAQVWCNGLYDEFEIIEPDWYRKQILDTIPFKGGAS